MEEIRIRLAEKQDLGRIMEIMEAAHRAMEDPSRYITDPPDYVARHIRDEGFILLAEVSGQTAGFFMVVTPGNVEGNTGYRLDFPRWTLDRTAVLDSVAVDPAFQGRGIMAALLREALRRLEDVCVLGVATVAPDNGPSLRGFQRCGFVPLREIIKPTGETRYLMGRTMGVRN